MLIEKYIFLQYRFIEIYKNLQKKKRFLDNYIVLIVFTRFFKYCHYVIYIAKNYLLFMCSCKKGERIIV